MQIMIKECKYLSDNRRLCRKKDNPYFKHKCLNEIGGYGSCCDFVKKQISFIKRINEFLKKDIYYFNISTLVLHVIIAALILFVVAVNYNFIINFLIYSDLLGFFK